MTIAVGAGSALLIDESYNANPMSMRAAIAQLGQMPGRRLAVLGDMLELGSSAARLHVDLVGPLVEGGVAQVLCCGPLMKHLHEALPAACKGAHAMDSAGLLPYLRDTLQPGDVLLVKGSLGSRMGRIICALSERKLAAPSSGDSPDGGRS
jgi:UDP-N-acetylmuramyl pentapeptide synthase